MRGLAFLTIAALTACSLVVDTGGYAGESAAPDAGSDVEAADVVVAPDAAIDASGGGDADAGSDGLVARWTFDEGTGTVAHDVSGHGHDGTLAGGSWVTGKSGKAIGFNGTSDVVAIAASTDFDRPAGASFTITAWVQRAGTFNHSLPVSFAFSASTGYGLEAHSNTELNYWDGVGHVALSTAAMGAGEWHHVAVSVVNGVAAVLYFDGARIGAGAADGAPHACTGAMFGTSPYGDHFAGAIDDVRYYRRALSDAEVAATMTP